MKKVLIVKKIVLLLILSAFSLKNFAQSSPTDFPVSKKNTPILTDTVFVNYLTDFYTDLNIKSKNMDKIKSIAVANTISENDLNQIYSDFGYSTKEDFFAFINKQNQRARVLNTKYDFSNISNDEKSNIIQSASSSMPVANIVPLGGGNECEARRLRCIASVSAQSILMHMGCATADLTIILGIICHSAALVYQAAESGRCNDAAQDCSATQQ